MTLRQRLLEPRALLAPGVWDALSALLAEQAGFEALYLSGASIAYAQLGRSDVGLTTYSEVEDTLAHITERVGTPVILDADTGFGNALNVQRTVRGFERAGAAIIQLEDQTFPKRCGHLDGKSVVPVAEMRGKLRAALDARAHADTLILARTDALALEGRERTLDRAEAYLACGVDALFIEALRSPEQMNAACRRASSAARSLPCISATGTTLLPSRWPQRFGNVWSSSWIIPARARSRPRTVRCTLSALPKPVSASTITGVPTRSVMCASVSSTSL